MLYLKHLLRGVTLGLFDEAAAMEKFTKWSSEHDSEFAKRQESHKKSRISSSRTPVARRTATPVKPSATPESAPKEEKEIVDAPETVNETSAGSEE